MKKFLSVLLAMAMLLSLTSALAEEVINVGTIKGPTGMAMAGIMENNDGTYAFTVAAAPEELTAKIIKGEVDIAAVPANLASVLYNKTEGEVKLLSIISRSMLYLLEKGETIQSPADLEGKTIVMAGQGSTPEYVLNYVLKQNNINAAVEFKSEHAEVISLAASDMADVVVIPEPNVTALMQKAPDFRVALNLGTCFDEAAAAAGYENARLSMSAVVVRNDLLENNPEAVKTFLTQLEESILWATSEETMPACADAIAKHGIIPAAPVALKALPNCNLTFVQGADMEAQLTPMLQVLFDENPASVGGKLPGEDFWVVMEVPAAE
ncbi:MAG: ABC transporter substrate-binding protein [Clostridia bacterium]|nr:ABC transporter substrate-binding protein [Clostridia bacterium]